MARGCLVHTFPEQLHSATTVAERGFNEFETIALADKRFECGTLMN